MIINMFFFHCCYCVIFVAAGILNSFAVDAFLLDEREQPIPPLIDGNLTLDQLDSDPSGGSGLLDSYSYYRADRGFVTRQRAIVRALYLHRCQDAPGHDDFSLFSRTYNPRGNSRAYSDPTLVQDYVSRLEAGELLGRFEMMSFEPWQVEQFEQLLFILNDAFERDADLFYRTVAYFSTRVNMVELYTALTVIADSFRVQGYRIPSPVEVFPQMYTPKDIIFQANALDLGHAQLKDVYLSSRRGFGSPEEELAEFREHAQINAFHFLWHANFPSWFDPATFSNYLKDRKGELFMNFHHNLIQRYQAERVTLGWSPVESLDGTRPLNPGYAPDVLEASLEPYPIRAPDRMLQDVNHNRSQVFLPVSVMLNMLDEIEQGLEVGHFIAANGSEVPLANDEGSDVLGSALESSVNSVNREKYGNFHNLMHLMVSRVEDPNATLKLPAGVLLHQETSMMDPVFYQLHALVDQLNKQQKDLLEPYSKDELEFSGVRLINLSVQSSSSSAPPNELHTVYKNVSWDVRNAIDALYDKCDKIAHAKVLSSVRQPISERFEYTFEFESEREVRAVVRIFMAPKFKFDGSEPTTDQLRWSFFELDRFPVMLQQGLNSIKRDSRASTFSGSPWKSQRELMRILDRAYFLWKPLYVNRFTRACGWPVEFLLPRGSPEGSPFYLFAMISDFDKDFRVDYQEALRLRSLIGCSLPVGLSPDKTPFGYPLDKPFPSQINSFQQFLTPNMILSEVVIKSLR